MISYFLSDSTKAFKLELNDFADWTEEEINARFHPIPISSSKREKETSQFLKKQNVETDFLINWATSANPLGIVSSSVDKSMNRN